MNEKMMHKIQEAKKRHHYFCHIDDLVEANLVKIIIGSRRSGKSYYLYSIIQYLLEKKTIEDTQIFYVNKERLEYDEITDYRDLEKLFHESDIDTGQRFFVGLDEIQEVVGFEKFVNSLHSQHGSRAIIFITGSNSKLLSSQYATLLSGRYIEQRIYPLSFQEFIDFSEVEGRDYDELLEEYIQYGGLPQVPSIQSNHIKAEYLKGVYNTVFSKDVVEFFRVRNVSLLRKIHTYLFKELGGLFTAQNISKYFQSQKITVSVDTIVNYVSYSQDAFLVYSVPRYDIKGKKILAVNSKIYPLDTGLRNAVVGYNHFSEREKILEQLVLQQLLVSGREVYVGVLGEKEIDFIAEKDGRKMYIQVSYALTSEKVIKREFGNLAMIDDNHPKVVITTEPTQGYNEQGIEHKYIVDFLLDPPI